MNVKAEVKTNVKAEVKARAKQVDRWNVEKGRPPDSASSKGFAQKDAAPGLAARRGNHRLGHLVGIRNAMNDRDSG